MRERTLPALFAAALVSVSGCADTVRPVLGGLRIGPVARGPFVMPTLVNEESPFEYPSDAWASGVGGETVLHIHIASNGAVDTVAVAQTSGHRALDSASVAGARLLHYRPARLGDERVAVWAYLPVRYPMPGPANREEPDSR